MKETPVKPAVNDKPVRPPYSSRRSSVLLSPKRSHQLRGVWTNKLEFILSCLGYAVGLGNVWRFPYLCYSNGGGAFLIPYFLMLICAGFPLFFMELSFGQYASESPVAIWKVSPLFQGIGYGMLVISCLVGIYYNMILGWTIFYLYSSLTNLLPWRHCNNEWNTAVCKKTCLEDDGTLMENGTCVLSSNVSVTIKRKSPSDEYFHNHVLHISDGLHNIGELRWQLALSLLLAWIIVFLCLWKGVKSFGKVVYFTATLPYLLLFILLVRGLTLKGADIGIMFYLTPKWHKLLEAKVWGEAAVQIFFSLSPCWGGLITLASYNEFNNNCYKDAIIIAIGNSMTSIFAGFVIFSFIGFMAYDLGVQVEDVAVHGPGLAFVVYPEAVTKLPVSPLWSFLFFFMLLTLGLGTQFTLLETVVSTVIDEFPNSLRKRHKWVLSGVCFGGYIFGLFLCTQAGMYFLQILDNHAAAWSALIIGLFECSVISWVYGADQFLDDIKLMLGHYPWPKNYWKYVWKYVTPITLVIILIFTWVDFKPLTYGSYEFPPSSGIIGWCISFLSVSMIPLVATIKVCGLKGNYKARLKKLSAPSTKWGPALVVNYSEDDGRNIKILDLDARNTQILDLDGKNTKILELDSKLALTSLDDVGDNLSNNPLLKKGSHTLTLESKTDLPLDSNSKDLTLDNNIKDLRTEGLLDDSSKNSNDIVSKDVLLEDNTLETVL